MDVTVMIFKLKSSLLLLIGACLIVSCMDISPPSKIDVSSEEILHSIHLPFPKAVYGVGAIDTLSVVGILVTGDTIHISPSDIKWRFSRLTDAIEVDSLGVLRVLQNSATAIKVYASYKLGETTREASTDVFITDRSYDIETFKINSLDSARAGSLANAYFVLGVVGGEKIDFSQMELDILDVNGITPDQLSLNSLTHISYSVYSAATGKSIATSEIINFVNKTFGFVNPIMHPKGLYVHGNIQPGKYWIVIEAYLYKKHLRDSILFTQLPSAEVYFGASMLADGARAVVASAIIAQSCAIAWINNGMRDTLSLELPPSDFECEGGLPSSGNRVVVPPSTTMKLRSLGYHDGTTVEWKAFVGSTSKKPIASGTIKAQL